MNNFKHLYLKYKNKYISLKNQQGGINCREDYFTQHEGECWHDSLQMLLLFNNDIGDRIQQIIESKTIQEIIDSPKKYPFLLPINIDYDEDFNSILSKYITDMILRYQNKICTSKPPELKREISSKTGISTAIDSIMITEIKKEEKRIDLDTNHGGSTINTLICLQTVNYFFQNDTNKFINSIIYELNDSKLKMPFLDKFNGIIINLSNHAVCLFKCGSKYMFYDDNGVSDDDPYSYERV